MPSERTVTIGSKVGLHARPASIFVKAAGEAGIPVKIAKEGGTPVDASSILGVMTLGAQYQETVTLTADPDTLVREIDPTQDPVSAVGVPREYVATLSGQLVLEPTGEQGTTLHVPVQAAPRLVSEVSAQPVEFPGPDALTAPLEVTGRHVRVSLVEPGATSPSSRRDVRPPMDAPMITGRVPI